MSKNSERHQLRVSLKPSEKKFIDEYCQDRGFYASTVGHDIITMAIKGNLVTKSGKNYFSVHD